MPGVLKPLLSGPATALVSQGICAHSQCQNLSLACPALLSYLIPSSYSWFLTCQNLALSYSSPHKMLLHKVMPSELTAATSVKEVCILTQLSSRHLVTCQAQISTCQILNEKVGSYWVCLCLSYRGHRFLFFSFSFVLTVFASFRMRA